MIHFVGAGPGAPDLITLRGAELLKTADVVVYAGSLVNPALLKLCPAGCEIHNSAEMTLEQVLSVMETAEQEGKTTVRLHTGDPCLYGAIREQMDALDAMGILYDDTPGVSSFCGAAAAAQAEYTLPDVSQTVIITRAAGRIACGLQDKLQLGNLDSKRDWGYAKDYVECMWLMLQHERPEDFVIATGVQHTVREFTTLAFAHDGIDLDWQGTGLEEKGIDRATGKVLVEVNPAWFRPTDVDNLWGDPTKAKTVLGWNPQKTSYEQLCAIMADHDLQLAKREKACQ